MEQQIVIDELIATINARFDSDYRVTRRPDKEDRRSKEIDAYAEATGRRPLAIEHTSVESFTGQKLDSARFVKVLGALEQELEGIFDFGLDLTIRIAAISTGVDWKLIEESTKAWVLRNSPSLPFGASRHRLPGVPFELAIAKHRDIPGSVFIGRFAPPQDETQTHLAVAIAKALQHKYAELSTYRTRGADSVLILESDDIALTSPPTLYAAYFVANQFAPSDALDQIWFARTYEGPRESLCHLLCFRGPEDMMRAVNRPNAMFGPQHDEYWDRVVRSEPSLRRAIDVLAASSEIDSQ